MTDGKIRYLAGGFRDYKTLMESYRKLTAVGFKPVTAAWIDGQGVTLTAARAYETAQAKKAAATISECRIEIIPADGILSDVVKEILKTDAADKSIARVDKDGRIIYSVGIFTTTTDANAVADKIREQETSTEVNVEEQ